MTEARLALGQWGEELAVNYLVAHGWKILARNFRAPVGEIDIIARNRTSLLFVEVKTRRTTFFGTPQEAVGSRKQRQIIRTAQWYLQEHKLGHLQPRFDVIAIIATEAGRGRVEHFEHAFSLDSFSVC